MGRSLLLGVVIALFPGALLAAPAEGASAEGGAEASPEEKKTSPWKTRRKSTLNFELGFDSNSPRAISAGDPTLFLAPDLFAYLFAANEWVVARPGRNLRAELEVGGKLFLSTPDENVLPLRAKVYYDHRIGKRWILGSNVSYREKFQKVRDYRRASMETGLNLMAGRRFFLWWRAGAAAFDYKPNRAFAHLAPHFEAMARWKLSVRNVATLTARADYRLYHPDSKIYEGIPGGSFREVLDQGDRRELLPTVRLGWSYRSTFILSIDGAVSRSLNNSFGMDAWRFRIDGSLAYLFRPGTSILIKGGIQAAVFPDGNIFGSTLLIADETELQNNFTLRFSHALGKVISTRINVSYYFNEISSDEVGRFNRLVVQAGLSSRF